MASFLKNFSNNLFRFLGFQIKSTRQLPKENLLGFNRLFDIRTIIDVGANEGQFGLWARSFFPAAQIYSFEPVRSTFETLKIVTSRDANWHVFQMALSDTRRDQEIFHHIRHPSSSSLHLSTPKILELFPETEKKVLERIKCSTLDYWMDTEGLSLCDDILLKLDVQGHETHVLRGAEGMLKMVKVIIVEIITRKLYHNQAKFEEIVEVLSQNNLHFHGVIEHGFDKSGGVVSLDAVFVKDQLK